MERHDAAIGLAELAVQPLGLLFPLGEFGEAAQKLAVLLAERDVGIGERTRGGPFGQRRGRRARERFAMGRQSLGQGDDGAAAGLRADVEPVHQAAGAGDADPEAGLRLVAALENRVEIADAGPAIGDAHDHGLAAPRVVDPKFRPASRRVPVGVAGDLRDGGRDPRLVLDAETQLLGDAARPLAHGHDIVLLLDRDREQGPSHDATPRTTTTVASSRPREKSR